MLSSTHYGVYDNSPGENCNPLCSSISPCYNAYDSWLQMMADDGHERLLNMGPGNLLSPSLPALDTLAEAIVSFSSSLSGQPSFLFQDAFQRGVIDCSWKIKLLSSPKQTCTYLMWVQGEPRWLQGDRGLGCHLNSSCAAST